MKQILEAGMNRFQAARLVASICSLMGVGVSFAGVLPESARFAPGAVVEKGEQLGAINGIAFRFDNERGEGVVVGTPGAGVIGWDGNTNWLIVCRRDAMSDVTHCTMHAEDFWLTIGKDGRPLVSVGYEHYPRSQAFVRVDKSSPRATQPKEEGHFTFAESAAIVAAVAKGERLTTRYMKWPDDTWIDKERMIYGFKEALQLTTWAAKTANRK